MVEENQFVLETTYTINYTTKNPVPIPKIVDSLKSLEKLIKRTPAFIEKAFEDLEVVDVQIYVKSLKTGSLKEDFVIKYVFKGKENYEKAKEVIDKMLEDSTMLKTVVAMGIGALLAYGAMAGRDSTSDSTHISAYNSVVINVGKSANFTAEDINSVLDGVTDKKQLAKQVSDVVRPAKDDPEATIEMGGIEALTVDKGFISETPSEYSPPIADERTDSYSSIEVIVHASDRDRPSNWAGTVPGVVNKRVKFILGEKVDPKSLHGRINLLADIVVVSRFSVAQKKYIPQHIEIRATN